MKAAVRAPPAMSTKKTSGNWLAEAKASASAPVPKRAPTRMTRTNPVILPRPRKRMTSRVERSRCQVRPAGPASSAYRARRGRIISALPGGLRQRVACRAATGAVRGGLGCIGVALVHGQHRFHSAERLEVYLSRPIMATAAGVRRRGPVRRAASSSCPAHSQSMASTQTPPTSRSQCRWLPVDSPVVPTAPSGVPALTSLAALTKISDIW